VPYIHVQASSLANAGRGLFASQNIEEGTVICLYPGIYTPGLPSHVTNTIGGLNGVYLANSSDPMKQYIEQNEYILNLNDSICSGYIDAKTWSDNSDNNDANKKSISVTTMTLENPSAFGHFINHGSKGRSNVSVCSFFWKNLWSEGMYQVESCNTMPAEKNDEYFALPNTLRCDGSPWYFDKYTDQLIRFPLRDPIFFIPSSRIDTTSATSKMDISVLCGAAFYAIRLIKRGEE